jgi:hypothetical protein
MLLFLMALSRPGKMIYGCAIGASKQRLAVDPTSCMFWRSRVVGILQDKYLWFPQRSVGLLSLYLSVL